MKQQNIDWPLVIEEWRDSGESQAAFCRNKNLSYWKFRDALKARSVGQQCSKSKGKTPFVKLPVEHLSENQKPRKAVKPWLVIQLGADGFRFELNFPGGHDVFS